MFIHFFESLAISLKQTSKIFRTIFMIIALSFDELAVYLQSITMSFFIKDNLEFEFWAKERSIIKIKSESKSAYYKRILNAYSFLKNSSTKNGIESIISSFTQKKFMIRELYKEQFILGNAQEQLGINTYLQSHLASFYFVIEFHVPLTVDEKLYLEEIMHIYKPAHIGFHINTLIMDNWTLGETGEYLGISTYL